MVLQPNFLPVGSVVEKINISDEWHPFVIDHLNLKLLSTNPSKFNNHYRPIPLTPEILTEWCLFKYIKEVGGYCNDKHLIYKTVDGYRFIPHCTDDDDLGTEINYLHELQLLFLGMKQVLTVTIK